jgi:hypothetical protein
MSINRLFWKKLYDETLSYQTKKIPKRLCELRNHYNPLEVFNSF